MKDSIITPGYTINPNSIDFVRHGKDGKVSIHIGANVLTFEGEQADDLRDILAPPAEIADAANSAADARVARKLAASRAKADAAKKVE